MYRRGKGSLGRRATNVRRASCAHWRASRRASEVRGTQTIIRPARPARASTAADSVQDLMQKMNHFLFRLHLLWLLATTLVATFVLGTKLGWAVIARSVVATVIRCVVCGRLLGLWSFFVSTAST
jgi:hypothetical protein